MSCRLIAILKEMKIVLLFVVMACVCLSDLCLTQNTQQSHTSIELLTNIDKRKVKLNVFMLAGSGS